MGRDGRTRLARLKSQARMKTRKYFHFPCSADREQDCQPYPVDLYFAICDDHLYIHTAEVLQQYITLVQNSVRKWRLILFGVQLIAALYSSTPEGCKYRCLDKTLRRIWYAPGQNFRRKCGCSRDDSDFQRNSRHPNA